MFKMLVSVIVPVYNRADMLVESLESVYQQTYRPIELIIINDGSIDDTGEVVLQWKKKRADDRFLIQYHYQENKGAPAARNLGIINASGEYLQFLDSDDRLLSQKIENQIKAMKTHRADIAVCDFLIRDSAGNISETHFNHTNVWRKVAKDQSLSVFTPLFRKTLIGNRLKWNENLTIRQDKDFVFKLIMLTKAVIYTPGVWCHYIHHGRNQISATYHNKNHEFFKRVKGLLQFWVQNWQFIPARNFRYYALGVFVIFKKGLRKAIKARLRNFKQK